MLRKNGVVRGSAGCVLIVLSFLGNGCSVTLKHHRLDASANQEAGAVSISREAEGLDEGKVGWGRGTLFYIPIVPVYMTGHDNSEVMGQVNDALVRAGYNVSFVDSAYASEPRITCNVDEFFFNNFTWLFPFVPTWGTIKLTTNLERDGKVLWTRSFSEDGSSVNFADGYSSAANGAMGKIVREMVREFSSDQFRAMLKLAQFDQQ